MLALSGTSTALATRRHCEPSKIRSNDGFSQDRFEQEMQENDMKRRMMMESAFNLEVDIGNLGLDEQPEVIPAQLTAGHC